MTVYRHIFLKSWDISWKNKYLWIFGFFATFIGSGGEYEILLDASEKLTQSPTSFTFITDLIQSGVLSTDFLKNFGKLTFVDPFAFFLSLFSLILFVSIAVAVVWFVVVSQIAIFDGVAQIEGKKKIHFRKIFNTGIKYFGPVLGLNVIAKVLASIVLMIIGLPMYYFTFRLDPSPGIIMIYLFSYLVLLPSVIIIYFLTNYAIAYAVIEKKSFLESLELGWKLFLKHWLVSIELAAFLLLLNIAVILGMVLVLIILLLPVVLLANIFLLFGNGVAYILLMVLAILLALCVIGAVGAWFETFRLSSWVLLFRRLQTEGAMSKIFRVFHALPNKIIR